MNGTSLFEEKSEKSFNKFTLIFIVLSVVVFGSAYAFYKHATYEPEVTEEQINAIKTRDTVTMLLALPGFSGDEFRRQVLGNARVQRYYLDRKEIYFSAPESSEQEFNDAIDKFVVDRQKITLAEDAGGKFKLDALTLRKTPETGYFFKTRLENLKFDPNAQFEFPYQNLTYKLSMSELLGFAENKQVYGGRLAATTNPEIDGKAILFGNHGAMVARPDEPSLKRFVAQILGDNAENLSREEKIQKLLDFVTTQIEYDYREALGTSETLKRPNEVLMSRSSDCSNKSILMASFLEQIGEDYILLYCPSHITVGVPQGAFPFENNLSFEWDGKNYIVAETTLPNFQIGKTKVAETRLLNTVNYVQKPKQTEIIFEALTFRPLEFKYY